MYINVHSICIWRKHLVHDKSAPLLYHEQAFHQSLSYWHWVFCSQSQGFADKLLNIWLSGVQPPKINCDKNLVNNVHRCDDWRTQESSEQWSSVCEKRVIVGKSGDAGDHCTGPGQGRRKCVSCVSGPCLLSQPTSFLWPSYFLRFTVPPPPSKITPAHSRHNIMIYADD